MGKIGQGQTTWKKFEDNWMQGGVDIAELRH